MITPDDRPLDAYAALPADPELSAVRSFIQARRHVLDLGAGTGRIANPLGAAGHVVVAVDESAEMLAHVKHATAPPLGSVTLQAPRDLTATRHEVAACRGRIA